MKIKTTVLSSTAHMGNTTRDWVVVQCGHNRYVDRMLKPGDQIDCPACGARSGAYRPSAIEVDGSELQGDRIAMFRTEY